MKNKKLSALLLCVLPMLISMPAHSALTTGTLLTIDQGSGDCRNGIYSLICANLTGSYVMGGWSNGPESFSPGGVGFLSDGYDDATGTFLGGATVGAGMVIGVTQPYQGTPVGPGAPYDPTTGQNITTAFQMDSGSGPYPIWGTFYSTSPIVDNGDGTLDFTGLNMLFGEDPALFGPLDYVPGNATLSLIPGGGAFGAGRYALDYFAEDCTTGEFECLGILLHLEGSINAVPLPAAAWLFGSGVLGLMGIVLRRRGVGC